MHTISVMCSTWFDIQTIAGMCSPLDSTCTQLQLCVLHLIPHAHNCSYLYHLIPHAHKCSYVYHWIPHAHNFSYVYYLISHTHNCSYVTTWFNMHTIAVMYSPLDSTSTRFHLCVVHLIPHAQNCIYLCHLIPHAHNCSYVFHLAFQMLAPAVLSHMPTLSLTSPIATLRRTCQVLSTLRILEPQRGPSTSAYHSCDGVNMFPALPWAGEDFESWWDHEGHWTWYPCPWASCC